MLSTMPGYKTESLLWKQPVWLCGYCVGWCKSIPNEKVHIVYACLFGQVNQKLNEQFVGCLTKAKSVQKQYFAKNKNKEKKLNA